MFRGKKYATRIESDPGNVAQAALFSSLSRFGRKDNTFDQVLVSWRTFRV